MDIAIYRVANKKLFIDEKEGIMKIYPDLIENPKTKIKRMSQSLILKLVIPVVYVVIQTIILFFIQNPIFFMGLGAGIMACIFLYLDIDKHNSYLELNKKQKNDAVLSVSENRIQYIDNVTNRVQTVEWANIKQVLLTPNCICFMPDYVETKDMNAIIISRDYEIEVLELLKTIDKNKMIVFN